MQRRGPGPRAHWERAGVQRKRTRRPRGAEPTCPGKALGGGPREIILGNSATKLLVPSAFFLPQNRFEQKENHRASERLREKD